MLGGRDNHYTTETYNDNLAERGFDPRTSGLWAQHASTAPLCCAAASGKFRTCAKRNSISCNSFASQSIVTRSCGLMDKASDFGSGDCRFESCHDRFVGWHLI